MASGARELLVLRHGLAEEMDFAPDRDRLLTDEGRTDVAALGAALRRDDLLPDVTVASPAQRTRMTAEIVLASAGLGADQLSFDERIYEAGRQALLGVLEGIAAERVRVLLVCHNPGAARIIEHLSGEQVRVASGMLTVLQMPDDWRALDRDVAQVARIIRPEELRQA